MNSRENSKNDYFDDLPEFGRPPFPKRLTPEEIQAMDEATKTALLLQREAEIYRLTHEVYALGDSIRKLETMLINSQEEET